jgi:hypothetical protein
MRFGDIESNSLQKHTHKSSVKEYAKSDRSTI